MNKKAVNKRRVVFAWVCAAALATLLQATPALAQPSGRIVLWRADFGRTPDGPPPWLEASYDQTGPNTVTLTLTSHLSGTDVLWGLEDSSAAVGWAFYLDQPLPGSPVAPEPAETATAASMQVVSIPARLVASSISVLVGIASNRSAR